MRSYLSILVLIFIILIIYKYRKKIRLNDVLLASIVVVIGCSLYKRKVEGLCVAKATITDPADLQAAGCDSSLDDDQNACETHVDSATAGATNCQYVDVPTSLKDLFRGSGQPGASGQMPNFDEWTTWLSGSGHCVATDPTNDSDVTACTFSGDHLRDPTACLAVMKDDGTPTCTYYAPGSTTATSRDQSPTGTCTGTPTDAASAGATSCSDIPAFVASPTATNCPTDNGCVFTPTNDDNPVNFKLGYSNEDSSLITSVYNCDSTGADDSNKISCPNEKTLDANAQTEGIFGGTLFWWLTGEPDDTTAKASCCVTPS